MRSTAASPFLAHSYQLSSPEATPNKLQKSHRKKPSNRETGSPVQASLAESAIFHLRLELGRHQETELPPPPALFRHILPPPPSRLREPPQGQQQQPAVRWPANQLCGSKSKDHPPACPSDGCSPLTAEMWHCHNEEPLSMNLAQDALAHPVVGGNQAGLVLRRGGGCSR